LLKVFFYVQFFPLLPKGPRKSYKR
jgi:hypothetical protein